MHGHLDVKFPTSTTRCGPLLRKQLWIQELDDIRTRNVFGVCAGQAVFMELDRWLLTEHGVSEGPVVLTSTNSNVSVLAPGQMRAV